MTVVPFKRRDFNLAAKHGGDEADRYVAEDIVPLRWKTGCGFTVMAT